ncbi:tRNA-binding protein [Sphingorhabdus sp. Alg239-R122]|uniref:tRNA-binding protein n=1 Tax=Sphingorhabdus sp. Alg239-R122 TaxID=2305989 RepID=UPI0013DABEC3|nr:tRNA-binding protein [Sphingorhabdus sp. Alg239-R122]
MSHLAHDPQSPAAKEITFDDFLKVDIRIGTIMRTEEFPEARKPAYKIWIDFGTGIGIRKSSVQIVEKYTVNNLVGKQVAAVVNFQSRQIGPFMSQVLTLGFADEAGAVTLFSPDKSVPNGARLF